MQILYSQADMCYVILDLFYLLITAKLILHFFPEKMIKY